MPVLELEDVSLLVGKEPDSKRLLHEVSLKYTQGHYGAIVGPSGCGKSTLLKVIAGLHEPTTGSIRWEGRDLVHEEDLAPSEIGYVPQFSIAYDHLDVWESVHASANLRVSGLSRQEREERTERILHEVGLDGIDDRLVGVLSGGQRRRLSLALEMVTSPALLLADEVTSGLDPKSEEEMVRLLHKIAKDDKRMVLSVTHSLRHLDLYDSVLVLHEGVAVYHGPGEFLLHYFDVDNPEKVFPQLAKRRPEKWHRSWVKHRESYYSTDEMTEPPALVELGKEEEDRPSTAPAPSAPEDDLLDLDLREETEEEDKEMITEGAVKHSPNAIVQFLVLLGRRWKIFKRNRGQFWLHVSLVIGFPCLVVIFALDGLPSIMNLDMEPGLNPLERFQEEAEFAAQQIKVGSLVSGLVMFQVILLTLMGSNNGAREIASERLIYEKEKLGGVRPISYLGSKIVFLSLLVAVQSIWMAVFVKMICKFPGDLGSQILLLLLVNAAMTALCLGISSLMKSAEQASLVSIYLVGFQLPLSGAVLALPESIGLMTRPFIAAYWSWSGYLQTLRDTRFFEAVKTVSETQLSPQQLCVWVLCSHVVIGLFLAYLGCRRSSWQ